jgi:hypothetical protein
MYLSKTNPSFLSVSGMLNDRTAIPEVSWTLIMLTIAPETMWIL